jgi:protein TonB
MRSQQVAQADADLAAATSFGASTAAVAAVQRLGASAPAAAAQPAAGPDLASLAAHLQRTRYVAPEYPDRALNDRVSGDVTVQYTVDQKGRTRDVRVVQSNPPGVFDRAAIDAISRWHYRPAKYNGQPVAVPVRTHIVFKLPTN